MSTSDPTPNAQADRAREAARHVDRSSVINSEFSGSITALEGLKELLGIAPASNCSAVSVATAAAQLQHMEQATNDTAASRQRDQGMFIFQMHLMQPLHCNSIDCNRLCTAASGSLPHTHAHRLHSRFYCLQTHLAGVTFQQPPVTLTPTKPAAAQPAAAAAAAAAAPSRLLPAATSQGPIITTSPEESAQAQQAIDLLNSYDFKIYVSGCVLAFLQCCLVLLNVQAADSVSKLGKVACELRVALQEVPSLASFACAAAAVDDVRCNIAWVASLCIASVYACALHTYAPHQAAVCWQVLGCAAAAAAAAASSLGQMVTFARCCCHFERNTSQDQGMMAGATAVPLTPPDADIRLLLLLLLPCSIQTHDRVKA
jgi:hypothetical protein